MCLQCLVQTPVKPAPIIAPILARMDDMGLVERERFENDQRRVLVSVTEKGQMLAAKLAPQIEGVYAELEKQMGTDFAKDLYQTLDRLSLKLAR